MYHPYFPSPAGRRAALLAAVALTAIAGTTHAQVVLPDLPSVPLNDTDCNFETINPAMTVPPCTFNGTRTVTYNGRTRTVRNATTDWLTDSYSVAFSGNLKIDGVPVQTAMAVVWPYGNTLGIGYGPTDASMFFTADGQTVNVTANYNAEKLQLVQTGASGSPASNAHAYWTKVTGLTGTVNTIDIALDSYFETSDGGEYDYKLASLDPANIVNNSTALGGTFYGTAGNGAVQFGTLAGTATVTAGTGITPYPDEAGASNAGLQSLYQLGYAVTATVTTNLDAAGLLTPKVEVSQGIEMNGSKITGLAAGTGASDAVNKGQLDAAIAGVSGGGSPFLAVKTLSTPAAANGDASMAVGAGAYANGIGGTAVGNGAGASADRSVAVGINAASYSVSGVAIGAEATARINGTGNIAIGGNDLSANSVQGTVADGGSAVALGQRAAATAFGAIAIGGDGGGSDGRDPAFPGAFANAVRATAIGTDSVAAAASATAVGSRATGTGTGAVAVGSRAFASTAGSVAMGTDAFSGGNASIAIGAEALSYREDGPTGHGNIAIGASTGAVAGASGGTKTIANGGNSVAIGTGTQATGASAIALSEGATASATGAAAVGLGAVASGDGSGAWGASARSLGLRTTALGSTAYADGVQSTAAGAGSEASGMGALAFGPYATARGSYTTALGYTAYAPVDEATAIGHGAQATGVSATAIGHNARAQVASATAIGNGAIAGHAGSTAIGAGAQTTAANQLVLGNANTAVVVAGIDASTNAQVGPVDAVTVDASGTLGRQRVATAAAVQEVRASIDYISAVTDSQFADLSGRVAGVETRMDGFDLRLEGIEGGVAAAMAMGQAKLVPDANVSMTVAAATYGGKQGYAGSVSGRVSDKVYVSGSVSGNSGDKRVGGAVSATFGF